MSNFIKINTTAGGEVILNKSEISSVEETRYSDRNASAITMNDKRVYYSYTSVDDIYKKLGL